jgi:thiol-disulfide isomerase/thioredoxin
MAATPSTMIPLGTKAPDFTLLDTISNKTVSLQTLKSDKATVIMFICNHCPFVKHIQTTLAEMARAYQAKDIRFIAINSNDVANYPDDSPDNMQREAKKWGYTFPYLFDETQEVAKAYQAACTPDFFVFDHNLQCVYRGRFDDSTPGNGRPVTGDDLRGALDAVLTGKAIDSHQQPSIGCNIKWKNR